MRYSEEQIKDAAGSTLGGVPASWNLTRVSEGMEGISQMANQTAIKFAYELYPPASTYLFWLLRVKGLQYLTHVNSVISADAITNFNESYQDMAEDALLQAKLDKSNFVAEQDITEDIAKLIESPVLAISELYRYIVTQEKSIEFLASDELIRKAVKELRVNPFLYFVYGDDSIELMPILWEEL